MNDFLRDDMLLKVTGYEPWYANIVNFMVAGYVPLGENKRKLIHESSLHLWMNRTSFESALMDYSGGVFRLRKQLRSSRDVTLHHMEDIMGHSALIQKSSKVDSIGQPCMTILETSYGGVLLVRNTGVPM